MHNATGRSGRCSRALLCATSALAMACAAQSDASSDGDYARLLPFDTVQLRLIAGSDTTRLTAELAETAEQQTMGLMERRSLAPDAGMLFLYPTVQPATSGFWMFRTRLPLDIAFIDSLGTIRTIQTMVPCPSSLAQGCPTYPASAPYLAALEVNAGYFAKQRIGVGGRVLLQDTSTRRRARRAAPNER